MKKRTPKETEAYFDGFAAAGEAIPIIAQRLIAKREHKLTPTQKYLMQELISDLYIEVSIHF